ncbi:MAG: hypothetical protein E7487_02900 [Ruminococcaceae bacterium]|nr:hypothetical protein [Oscillospiraceae bacterium]
MVGELFPRTIVGGVSLSRMIIGSNWMLGYSHRSSAADQNIKSYHSDGERAYEMFCTFLENGVDTFMSILSQCGHLLDSIKRAEQTVGRKMILVDTPILNVDNNEMARQQARETVRQSKELGATFCLLHHSCAEQLVCKNTRTIDRLPDYLSMIREEGMLPGLSAHMPELVIYSDLNEYDVETYIQLYNCMGFLMQIEVESVNQIIWNAKKPVMTIKPMAAGRVTPFVGLNFSWATLRPCDMVTIGCMNAWEAAQDIEISRAYFEGRAPMMEGRASPKKTDIIV